MTKKEIRSLTAKASAIIAAAKTKKASSKPKSKYLTKIKFEFNLAVDLKMAGEVKPNCYEVAINPENGEPKQISRPHIELKKLRDGVNAFETFIFRAGVYRYVNIYYSTTYGFNYAPNKSGYFVLAKNGKITPVNKDEVENWIKLLS